MTFENFFKVDGVYCWEANLKRGDGWGKLERGGLPIASAVRLGAGAVVVSRCWLSPFWITRFSRTSIWSAEREAARVESVERLRSANHLQVYRTCITDH